MKTKSSCSIDGFKYPASDRILGRTSTICRSMACTLLKREACTKETEQRWKRYFPIKTCAYCGKPASHLDHLYPLIVDRKPTGYGTEPGNLVPCCKDCNQPKGNLDYEEYMNSSLCEHQVIEGRTLEESKEIRIQIIKDFQNEMPAEKIEISEEVLAKWNEILYSFDNALENAEKELIKLKETLYKK